MKRNIKRIIGILIMIGLFLLWFIPRVMIYIFGLIFLLLLFLFILAVFLILGD